MKETTWMRQQRIAHLFDNALAANVSVLLAAAFLVFFLFGYVDSSELILWMMYISACSFLRIFLQNLYEKNPSRFSLEKWWGYYTFLTLLTGIGWAGLSYFFYIVDVSVLKSLLFVSVLGVILISVGVLAASILSFLAYTVPQVLAMLVATFIQGGDSSSMQAFMVLLFMGLATVLVRKSNKRILHNLRLQEDNASLIKKLNYEVRNREGIISDRTGQLEKLNETLMGEIEERKKVETELLEQKEELHYQARYDSLTGLPNRLLFIDRLNQVIKLSQRHNTRAAILFIDLDRFKSINDSLGHAVGDELLKILSQRLRSSMREFDTAARMGGDEFMVIFTEIKDTNVITDLVVNIGNQLSKECLINDYKLAITTSIGVSIYPDDGTTSQELIKQADAAMYKAKDEGRNTYRYYTEDMTRKAYEHLEWENRLRSALDNNELQLHYQPQVDVSNNKITGMEALVRWFQPEQGFIPPDTFIPLAEETGLIRSVGAQVLDMATRQIALWKKQHPGDYRVAINISARQLEDEDVVSMIMDILDANRCRPEWIELEVTEGYIMKHPERSVQILEKLRSHGINISIDDFGTGYSSLSYLKRLPINKLKIDRSFVNEIEVDENDKAIVAAVISLARTMSLDVIAEGVETLAQRSFLQENGCKTVQGYLYSKPVAAEEMGALLKSGVIAAQADEAVSA